MSEVGPAEIQSIMGFIALAGLLVTVGFVLWLYALIQTVRSKATDGEKVAWLLLLIFIPFVSVIVWLFIGPRPPKAGSS